MDKAPVAVTLIQPTAVNTPFAQHARNFTDREPKLPSPVIDPGKVAAAILAAATKPTRSKRVGAKAVVSTTVSKVAPGLADKMAAKEANRMHYDEPPRNPEGALDRSSEAVGLAGRIYGSSGPGPQPAIKWQHVAQGLGLFGVALGIVELLGPRSLSLVSDGTPRHGLGRVFGALGVAPEGRARLTAGAAVADKADVADVLAARAAKDALSPTVAPE
jgi:hypothetical protein